MNYMKPLIQMTNEKVIKCQMNIKPKYKQGEKMPKKPKRNKLSKRRSEYKRKYKEWQMKQIEQQRQQAWLIHEMIDEDLRNLQYKRKD